MEDLFKKADQLVDWMFEQKEKKIEISIDDVYAKAKELNLPEQFATGAVMEYLKQSSADK